MNGDDLVKELKEIPTIAVRKLYRTQGSFILTIPKSWVDDNGLEHKSSVECKVIDGTLVLIPQEPNRQEDDTDGQE